MSLPALRAAIAALGATWAVRALADRLPEAAARPWVRTNHAGRPVSMLEGPSIALGVLAGLAAGAGARGTDTRAASACAVAVASGAAFGLVDDLGEDPAAVRKGLRGHLGALARGQVTTGGLKVLGIGAGGLLAAGIASGGATSYSGAPSTPGPAARASSWWGWGASVVADGALIAVSANLVNLLDLRPGRALKVVAASSAPLLARPGPGRVAASAAIGAAAAAAPRDLAGEDMLGDGGANALGAAVGAALVVGTPRPVRLAALGAGLALTAVSEQVSFTRVIESTPVLRRLDAWGRPSAPPTS